MYSVVEIGGSQYRVEAGDLFDVEKLELEEGAEVSFDKVLFVGGAKPLLGMPVVAGALVKAKVVRQARDRKIMILKKPDKKWKRSRGHRQHYTALLVTEITDGKGNVSKIDAKSTAAQKHLK